MFNLHGCERLTEWKKFRESLETSNDPFQDVASFWSNAPFVSPYLDPQNPSEWPDPWHLVLDLRLDDLAIALGMLYTLKLTTRFMDSKFEIHTSMFPEEKSPRYILIVDNQKVLNLEYKKVLEASSLSQHRTSLIWSS